MAARTLLPCMVVLSLLLFFSLVSSDNVRPTQSAGASQFPPLACPKDALKLGICANLLNKLLNLIVGDPPKNPCCSLIQGLVDVGAGVCLCTAIKANVLGINLNVPVALSLLVNYCDENVPADFQCP